MLQKSPTFCHICFVFFQNKRASCFLTDFKQYRCRYLNFQGCEVEHKKSAVILKVNWSKKIATGLGFSFSMSLQLAAHKRYKSSSRTKMRNNP